MKVNISNPMSSLSIVCENTQTGRQVVIPYEITVHSPCLQYRMMSPFTMARNYWALRMSLDSSACLRFITFTRSSMAYTLDHSLTSQAGNSQVSLSLLISCRLRRSFLSLTHCGHRKRILKSVTLRSTAATHLYGFYYDAVRLGTYIWEVEAMHKQYGKSHAMHVVSILVSY